MRMLARRCAALCCSLVASGASAQQADAPQDSTFDLGWLADDDHGGLTITSGKTYNRVEGLPILFGPTYKGRLGRGDLTLSALGILRTAHGLHWDAENIGHKLSADWRMGGRRGVGFGAQSFDVVEKIEPWQLSEPDGALAAFFGKRDYFDYFGRHGARGYLSAFRGEMASISVGYGRERWSSRRARDVFTLFRDDDSWRVNPRVNDGLAHVVDFNADIDTRNNAVDPWAGWLISAKYEYGAGTFRVGDTRIAATEDGERKLEYGRVFLDLRRYNRISPKRQLNARLVLGGWVHGDPLPFERRFSVGGPGTLPGFDFRRVGIGTDVGQCSPESGSLPGRPAECERLALGQLEYRHELVSELFDVFNRNGIRVRGAVFRVKPTVVAFVDAGRGWLIGSRDGRLTYPAWSFPGFDTFRTDVGVGLDLGVAGVYVAKAVSSAKEPANVFVRFRNRF
ncbi:MAG TPA: BamA/TamA family outer membrane protein [Gemmatimonadaceae bacterium]|nr:BamA/TamA family outer membrane protein [Gemmatimonadaceae bacterium]